MPLRIARGSRTQDWTRALGDTAFTRPGSRLLASTTVLKRTKDRGCSRQHTRRVRLRFTRDATRGGNHRDRTSNLVRRTVRAGEFGTRAGAIVSNAHVTRR